MNPFFSPEKRFDIGPPDHTHTFTVSVYTYSTTILVGSSLALLGLLHWVLRRQLRTKR